MKKSKRKIISILLIATSIISIGINAYSHSGRTDSSGGHKDNKNKSGLGSYHYHCGGNPAHLHTNGVCPYSSKKSTTSGSSSSKSSSGNSSKSTSSNTKTTTQETSTTTNKTEVPDTILATGIQINENIERMNVGENKKLTATITPENVTDKNITWKSSDENIVTVSTTGEIIAKKAGTVEITASTTNGKTNTIKINIKEEQKSENTTIINTSTINSNNTSHNTINSSSEDSNPIGGILTLGLLGGGSYWGYNRYKKSKE